MVTGKNFKIWFVLQLKADTLWTPSAPLNNRWGIYSGLESKENICLCWQWNNKTFLLVCVLLDSVSCLEWLSLFLISQIHPNPLYPLGTNKSFKIRVNLNQIILYCLRMELRSWTLISSDSSYTLPTWRE